VKNPPPWLFAGGGTFPIYKPSHLILSVCMIFPNKSKCCFSSLSSGIMSRDQNSIVEIRVRKRPVISSLIRQSALLFSLMILYFGCATAPRYTRGASEREISRPENKVTGRAERETHGKYYQVGMASYYANKFHGRKTANGEIFNMNALTAAHPVLPFNTVVKVTNLKTGRSVEVRINDRGPFSKKRIIDLSRAAAKEIGLIESGVGKVGLQVIRR